MLYQHVPQPFARRHPVLTVIAAATLACWVALGWYEAVALAVAAGLLVVARRRRRAAAIREAGLRARAEYENRLTVSGDPRGLYGRYSPYRPNWYPDPQNPCLLRYFDGVAWTPHVSGR
ncbi:DUF2510 domain-containing protein [Mycolicibacterium gilvum]|uniref:Protein of uncharacterized function (DUF2510) n=1 Tax=Mycolicibacterium gilvum TaxID=1804 RepID=A0A378STY0_9MYCO|nr:DUF2510 domain-containing protein [Mycolicibacterium gilvum]MCV7056432.1 DUF2510 domain-containing protein [Mycolicibacterium gilvum]STZ45558.1 Protein of uncharacterised function (DUF2510) [Mycolicibacterium gilvum]